MQHSYKTKQILFAFAFIVVAMLAVFAIDTWLKPMVPIGTATISWNANTEPDLAGYKVYYGTSPRTNSCPPGGYYDEIDIGNATSHTFNNLAKGKIYYFSITSYDKNNNESCFSDEAQKGT